MSVTLAFRGAPLATSTLPRILLPSGGRRAAEASAEDPFLPRGLVEVEHAFDLSSAARDTEPGRTERLLVARSGQVVVLEMPDGVSVVTSGEKLIETLRRIDPGAIDAEGRLLLGRALRDYPIADRSSRDLLGQGLEGLVSRIFVLTVGAATDPIVEDAKARLAKLLGEKLGEGITKQLGVTWLGTKALLWAIEARLEREPGLYRWSDGTLSARSVDAKLLDEEAKEGPLLVFIHGTGSNTAGSFAELRGTPDAWRPFEEQYGDRIYAFEHRTLSEGPIENALELAKALPAGAAVHLVTHSRGGLVGDLLCLDSFDALIEQYGRADLTTGEADVEASARLRTELEAAYEEQRKALQALCTTLGSKKLRVERYVRVAAPSRGTRLASGNFDVFLSGLLSLIGWVPALSSSLLYSAFKRVVLEIAKNRTNPRLVPGIEALLPEAPMGRFLTHATPVETLKLGLVAGDVDGGGLLKRLGVLFTDFLFFDSLDNDLVVDTDSMYCGVARPQNARVLFDRSAQVSHFGYFKNEATRLAVRDWLTAHAPEEVAEFLPLDGARAPVLVRSAALRDAAARLPIVVVVPGIMGSHIRKSQTRERVWLSVSDVILHGLDPIRWAQPELEAEELFEQFYGALCAHLEQSHRVERFPYDWRQPLDVLADALDGLLRSLLAENRPLRVLAHSMGGLVVRALIHRHPGTWDPLMQRDGARFVMLGTPNQGSHSMVESLLGKSDTVRSLGRASLKNDLQQVLDIVAEFPGALQLLPKPGFLDAGYRQLSDDPFPTYFDPSVWALLKGEMADLWFGNRIAATPTLDALERGSWLWRHDGPARPSLPRAHSSKVAYVFGSAAKTPCGIVKDRERWKMLGTTEGDGSVTWSSGRIDGIGAFFYMPAEHGALADTAEYFDALTELLEKGSGGDLLQAPPRLREGVSAEVQVYDAGPAAYPSSLAAPLLFAAPRRPRRRPRRKSTLEVSVKAMDVRCVTRPILVGHYEDDAISGAEAIIDRHLVHGELSVRRGLGMYADRIGSATAVFRPCSDAERRSGSFRGAIVTGLGKYDGTLTCSKLTEAVCAGALRYLLHVLDSGGAGADGSGNTLRLSTLLIGYNSSASLTITDSVGALIRGVVEANRKFAEQVRSGPRIGSLQIVELYLDTALSAAYSVQDVAHALNRRPGAEIEIRAAGTLEQGEGVCNRLLDARRGSYWPRLLITQPVQEDDAAPGDVARPRSRTEIAHRIQFLLLGERARAESELHERQPGTLEGLIAGQLANRSYQESFSRSLFQLMIPHDLKDAARQLEHVVLVVDGYTANLPWELMLADDVPLSVKVPMVRQLASPRFRRRVNQAAGARAYVIGNPSTAGSGKSFPDKQGKPGPDPAQLPEAEDEAVRVADVLTRHGFEVQRAIGAEQAWPDVITSLYRHPYRILHIAAHGMYDVPSADGTRRSGVILSDGHLITASEIDAMENVPDLVFLNCCHLGKADREARAPTEFNKLAYSVARELIEDGVRAVVVAGWAVGDVSARYFAEAFYTALLGENQPFGEAVFIARKAIWEQFPTDVTWGAFQAYGDPGWQVDTRLAQGAAQTSDRELMAPDELISAIQAQRLAIGAKRETPTRAQAKRCAAELQKLLRRSPQEWRERPDIQTNIGALFADLGPDFYAQARQSYLKAIQGEDLLGRVPIRAIEQLARVEARQGEVEGKLEPIQQAIGRLEHLDGLAGGTTAAPLSNPERVELLGGAYERKAAVLARQLLASANAEDEVAAQQLEKTLAKATKIYARTASKPHDAKLDLEATLRWLRLRALTLLHEQRAPDPEETAILARCAEQSSEESAAELTFRSAGASAETALVRALLACSTKGAAGEAAFEPVRAAYDRLRSAPCRPADRDAVLARLEQTADVVDAKARSHSNDLLQKIPRELRSLGESMRAAQR